MNSELEYNIQSKKFNNLIKWCMDNGGYAHSSIIRKKNILGHYGIFATEKIEKDTIIFKIPKEIILDINNTIVYDEFEDNQPIKLIISILIEYKKKDKSNFYHSFSLLPSYEDLIKNNVYHSNEEIQNNLEEIGYKIKYIINNNNKIINTIMRLNNKYNYVSNLNYNDINYCLLIFKNYCWENYDPVICFLNHKTGNSNRNLIINGNNQYMEYKVNKVIEKNEEIFISYGDNKSTEELAFNYNFVDINILQTSININFTDNTPIGFYKAKLLQKYNFLYKFKDNDNNSIQAYLQFVNMNYITNMIISENNYSILTEISSILSIKNIKEIEHRNIIDILLQMRIILQINLKALNQDKINMYIENIRKHYPHIALAIENRQNILTNIINQINNKLLELIK